MDDLLTDFVTESTEQLEAVGAHLVALEGNPEDLRAIGEVFRLVHSIKGTCGFLGLDRLGRLAHAAEALISRLREGAAPTPERISLVLDAMDRFRDILTRIAAAGAEPDGDDTALVLALERSANSQAPVAAESVEQRRGRRADPAMSGAQPQRAGPRRETATIRLAVPALEQIMNLVSELVLTRNQLLELTRDRPDDELTASVLRLNTLTGDLQDGVMRARMQPIGRLFASLPRLVRELSHQLGKKIELVTDGAGTELDRQLVELIRDPITHMIRNCADHGIESADARVAAGKASCGQIRIAASHDAGNIKVVISDDGRGLDVQRIGERALALGLVDARQLARMSSQDVCRFVFAPGFSTAPIMSSISGRGIGLDVVRESVESIGGSVTISTLAARGTTFTLKIPLTLAIAPALIVECGGQKLAFPQHAVIEAVGAGDAHHTPLSSVHGALLLQRHDQVIPVLDLAATLKIQSAENREDAAVVVMRVGAHQFDVLVDSVSDVQEVVIKPLASALSGIPFFSGSTMLGDGSVVLIVDPSGLAAQLGFDRRDNFIVAAEVDRYEAVAEPTRLVLFRTRPGAAVLGLPLSLLTRIETVAGHRMTRQDDIYVMQAGEEMMPLVSPDLDLVIGDEQKIMVVGVGGQPMGIIAHEIVDIVETQIDIQIASASPRAIGSALVAGFAVELLDVAYFMQLARPGAFRRGHARRFKILLVDDKAFFRDMLSPVLTAEGYQVTTAASAADALALFQKGAEFDAILTDIDMPDLDGYSFAKAILADRRFAHVPVLALDAHAAPAVLAAVKAAGMKGVVGKFDRHALLRALASLLDQEAFNSHAIERRIIQEAAA
ncbi:MAG: hybrid sensor histidine kinase/response regulator [Hyphomicrobiales bacterium]|nr:hybrid sensor histidine kinase/response regulator [Hyphomicrobiales bacterium]